MLCGAKIERALDWKPSSAEQVLVGGEPTLIGEPGPAALANPDHAGDELVRLLRQQVLEKIRESEAQISKPRSITRFRDSRGRHAKLGAWVVVGLVAIWGYKREAAIAVVSAAAGAAIVWALLPAPGPVPPSPDRALPSPTASTAPGPSPSVSPSPPNGTPGGTTPGTIQPPQSPTPQPSGTRPPDSPQPTPMPTEPPPEPRARCGALPPDLPHCVEHVEELLPVVLQLLPSDLDRVRVE